jgi:nucleoside-triphosphatase THEP1
MSARVKIITGPRNSGKTRAAAAFAADSRLKGLRVGGVVSEAEVRRGVKTSYTFVDLSSGERALYAVKHGLAFEFLAEGLEFGKRAIRDAVERGADVVIVDECGPLEMRGGGVWGAVHGLPASVPGIVVIVVREGLVEQLIRRLGIDEEEWETLDTGDAPPSP